MWFGALAVMQKSKASWSPIADLDLHLRFDPTPTFWVSTCHVLHKTKSTRPSIENETNTCKLLWCNTSTLQHVMAKSFPDGVTLGSEMVDSESRSGGQYSSSGRFDIPAVENPAFYDRYCSFVCFKASKKSFSVPKRCKCDLVHLQ